MRVAGIRVGSALCCAATLLLALVAGCDQLSDVGKVKEAEPTAIATSIGEAFANDADGNMTMTVRAGADVVLSGKESQKGADDKGIPIINFDWQQSQADSVPVQLIYRTSNTVSFMAPQVTSDTTLHFTLTVSDAKGAGDYATATVVVKNVRDQDRFLQYPVGAPGAVFSLVLATQADIAPVLQAGATDYVTATVKVTRLLTFRDRDSDALSTAATFTRVPIGAATTISTGWTTRLGSSASCTSPVNPVVRLPIPHLNLDEALASLDDVNDPTLAAAKAQLLILKSRYPDAVILSDVLEASDLSGAGLKLELQVDVTPAAGVAKPCLKDTNGSVINVDAGNIVLASPSSSVTVPVESASAQIGTPAIAGLWPVATPNRDSRESAQAYYKAIDPLGDKTTLNDWLATNGFNAALPGYGADAHAVYTNNYDLGFGRDMYLRYGACDAGAAALPLQSRVGKCDVAAVVLNYPNMEAAAKKLNSFAAVAMEYSKVGGAGKRFVKFYTFVPDTRDGVYKRALSLNFDRRGEQYMPQACVVCHGGTPGTYTPAPPGVGTYANGGDVKAAFLPWDLESFLFSAGPNADPGFSHKARDATLRDLYTRAAQESQFKLLNVGAYLTMANGLDQANNDDHRFDLGRELVEKWYGGLLGGNLKNDSYDDSAVPDGWSPALNSNPPDSADIYHNVFARNCRTCHALHVPGSGDPRTVTVRLNNVDVPACSTPAAVNTSVGASSQVPMGCYWEFAHAPSLADRLARNQMPLARRTSDRIWVSADGSQTAGSLLQAHLLSTQDVTVATPGAVNSCIDPTLGIPVQSQGTTKYQVARTWIYPTMTCSRFVDAPKWTLSAPNNSRAALAGVDTSTPRFVADKQGDYSLTLDDGAGTATTEIAQVPVVEPIAVNGGISIALGAGGTGSQIVDTTSLSGYTPQRDALKSISVVMVTGAVSATPQGTGSLNITVNSLAGGTVVYRLTDIDDDLSNNATINVTATATLALSQLSPTVQVASNSTTSSITLSNYVSNPTGQALVYTIGTPPGLFRSLSLDDNWSDIANRQMQTIAAGSATINNGATGALTYTLPSRVLTTFNTTQVGPTDSFTFRACFASQPATCTALGTVNINLTSASGQSFFGLTQQLATACGSCHAGAQAGSSLVMPVTFVSSSWVPPASGTASSKSFYCELLGLSTTGGAGNEPDKTAYMDLTTPADSLLYRKPRSSSAAGGSDPPGTLYHGGGVQGSTTWAAILNWINEGAYFTEGNSGNQNCP